MHEHDHHSHHHGPGRKLRRALLIVLGFAFVEAVAGWWANSLALMSDAAHMLTDSSALGLAVVAAWYSRQPADAGHSWGHGRAEVLAALGNAVLMLALVAGIVLNAWQRFRQPVAVEGLTVLGVAALGLAVNLLVLRTLSHGHQTLNTRGAMLHVIGDTLASIAALASGAVILATGWTPIDPILSLGICVLILGSGLRLIRDSLNVVMEGVPAHLDLDEIGRRMARVRDVVAVHDLHVWQVNSERIALSAHVVLRDMRHWVAVLDELNRVLKRSYGIDHATLQPEPVPEQPLRRLERGRPRRAPGRS